MNHTDRKTQLNTQHHSKGTRGIRLWDWLRILILAVVIAVMITTFVFNATLVEGNSMNETLHDQDRLFVYKFLIDADDLKRGDIVVFRAPDDREKDYIKRVIGLPNEFVQIIDGRVYVNGERVLENYINTEYTHTEGNSEWYLADDEIFVLGDNRIDGESKDSRVLGPIHSSDIVGVAVFRFYPWSQAGSL